MTITENRPAERPASSSDAPLQARALLLDESSAEVGRQLPAVVISALDELRPESPVGDGTGLPVLDGWIVDLSLRDQRITVVTRTDVLCSAPLLLLPEGWTAEVAAQGLLVVVVQFGPDGPSVDPAGIPPRAMQDGTLLAVRVPVCLS